MTLGTLQNLAKSKLPQVKERVMASPSERYGKGEMGLPIWKVYHNPICALTTQYMLVSPNTRILLWSL